MNKTTLCVMFLALCGMLRAQSNLSPETNAYVLHPKGFYVLQNLTIIDGKGNAPITNQDIIIEGEVIKAIGTDLAIPENATVIDMKGKSAIPGFVMLHEHLFYPKIYATLTCKARMINK